MRVPLKGINRITKRLADGSKITYFYAWKGGPRLHGTPGSPEFQAKRAEQKADKPKPLTILATSDGTTWTESGFRASWRKACARAGITGLTFHDLHGTAVTRLAEAECEVPEIAAITGHSLRDAATILNNHYLS